MSTAPLLRQPVYTWRPMRPKTLWLNLLPTLNAILHAKTITEAAERAYLTQPALSIALRKARAHFNDELVVYNNGRSELTELGEALRPRVRAALDAAREALDLELKFEPANSVRTVRMLANSTIEFVLMPCLLPKLYAEAPQLFVSVQSFTQLPAKAAALEDVDIAFGSQFFDSKEYSHATLFSERMTALVWNDHPTIGDEMTMDEFFAARHATTIAANDRSPAMFRKLAAAKRLALWAPSAAALPHMIVGTDLVITGLFRYCSAFTHHLPLRIVKLIGDKEHEPTLNIDVAVFWKPYRDDEPFIRWLVSKCKEVAHELAAVQLKTG
jgi:LysR family transcriptional regulator, nod-box dependent transcriptional activator